MSHIQYCPIHKMRIITSVCLDTSCKEKSLICNKCLLQQHRNCNGDLVIEKDELKSRVIIKGIKHNTEHLKTVIKEKANKLKKNFLTQFDKWLCLQLKACDEIDHKDLFNLKEVELIKSNYNIKLTKSLARVELAVKLDDYNKKELESKLDLLENKLTGIIDGTLSQIKELGSFLEGKLINSEDEIGIAILGDYYGLLRQKVEKEGIKMMNESVNTQNDG